MNEKNLNKKDAIAELSRSTHRQLTDYGPMAVRTALADPEFYGHLIAWNHQKGAIRDSKVALPVYALTTGRVASVSEADHFVLIENALAHLADLKPKQFMQATEFARTVHAPTRLVRRLITRYLRDLEADRRDWERTAVQHREFLRTMYAKWHIAPGGEKGSAQDVALMKRDAESGKFAIVRTLKDLPTLAVVNAIQREKLPFLTLRGALGERAKEPDILMALVNRMTPTELVTNARALKKLGVLDVASLRATFEDALARAGKKQRKTPGAVLKATTAAEVLEDEGESKLAPKLRALQEKQLDHLKTIDGDWLILGDCSSSMTGAIEAAQQIAGILARLVKGRVHLVFFNTDPRYFEVTGKSYEDIVRLTRAVTANGGTTLGVGLDYITARKIHVDGIAMVSDGDHNHGRVPHFSTAYQKYVKALETEPTIYYYILKGQGTENLRSELTNAKIQFESFDLRGTAVDRYSLPNLAQTMRVNRYSLVDEIMDTPLRMLDEVLRRTKGQEVINGYGRTAVGA